MEIAPRPLKQGLIRDMDYEVEFGATEEEAQQIVTAIAEQLTLERNRRGWTQKDIAERCDLTRRNVGYVEDGKGGTAPAIKYAAALGMSYALIVAKAEAMLEAERSTLKRFNP